MQPADLGEAVAVEEQLLERGRRDEVGAVVRSAAAAAAYAASGGSIVAPFLVSLGATE